VYFELELNAFATRRSLPVYSRSIASGIELGMGETGAIGARGAALAGPTEPVEPSRIKADRMLARRRRVITAE